MKILVVVREITNLFKYPRSCYFYIIFHSCCQSSNRFALQKNLSSNYEQLLFSHGHKMLYKNKTESFLKVLSINSHIFGRAVWDKLPECNFENKTRAISKFSKIMRVIYPKNCPNQTCGYWLITPNQQTLRIETNIF